MYIIRAITILKKYKWRISGINSHSDRKFQIGVTPTIIALAIFDLIKLIEIITGLIIKYGKSANIVFLIIAKSDTNCPKYEIRL